MKRDWKRTLELWQESGLDKKEFCTEHNIPMKRFYYHFRKYYPDKDVRRATDGKTFAELLCREESDESNDSSPNSLTLILDYGYRIEVPENFNPKLLRNILKAVSNL